MKIGTYDIDLRSVAVGAIAVWLIYSFFGGSSGCASSPGTGHWYDYGNGMLNLDQVTRISFDVDFGLHISEEGKKEMIDLLRNRKYPFSSLPQTIGAKVMFDDFTLRLESHEINKYADIKDAFSSWMQTVAEIKDAQK